MKKYLMLAALVLAVAAAPASASVQNVKVSGSIDSTWLYRDNFDLGESNTNIEDVKQNLFITQTLLRVDADLTDNVAATVQLINERVWETDPGSANSDIDLNLAFVTLREMLYSPLTVIVGRQVFSYGNSFIMDATGANNLAPSDSGISSAAQDLTKQTALDAVRLIFDYNPLTLEFMYSKVDPGTVAQTFDNNGDDKDLFGANATYELGDAMNTEVEAYFFAQIDKSTRKLSSNSSKINKSDTIYIPGFRASTNPIEGLNIQAELAWQRGNKVVTTTESSANVQRKAFAAQFIANYQVPVAEAYNPVVNYTFTHVSGDSNPGNYPSSGYSSTASGPASGDTYTAWDPFYEAQGGGTIYNALFDLTNLQIHSVSLQVNPLEDVTTTLRWTGLWLDKELDSAAGVNTFTLRQPDGTTNAVSANTGKTELGYEVDFETIYDYTEDVQFGASFGWFVPGDVFASANDSMASQAIVHGNVNF